MKNKSWKNKGMFTRRNGNEREREREGLVGWKAAPEDLRSGRYTLTPRLESSKKGAEYDPS